MFNICPRFAQLGNKFYQNVQSQPLDKPRLIHINQYLAKQLNLADIADSEWLKIINGNTRISGYNPLASLYAGHQFGVWVPQLGDGRAIFIAEHKDVRGQIWEMQLKGAGQTPYSRSGDGRAVLRSSIREYLCSHAMQALGIATTQALAIIDSQTTVYRESAERGAIVLRVAPSFIRFGHFEVFASRQQTEELAILVDFVINNYYPQCNSSTNKIAALLDKVADSTAKMIAKWQGSGFCHGVMNSDNMSVLGLTLDYGPFGFLDNYNPQHICNHSDNDGRYTYDNQPQIAWWNLTRLAESLTLLTTTESLQEALNSYATYFNQYYVEEMGNKLGINNFTLEDLPLLKELLTILAHDNVDWTIFWRNLSKMPSNNRQLALNSVLDRESLNSWLNKYLIRRQAQNLNFIQSQELMLKTNPAIVLRNHLAQNAIREAEYGNYKELANLFLALSNPFAEQAIYQDYYAYPPEWAKQLSISCSS